MIHTKSESRPHNDCRLHTQLDGKTAYAIEWYLTGTNLLFVFEPEFLKTQFRTLQSTLNQHSTKERLKL